MNFAFANRVEQLHGSAIREAFKALSKPGMISFAGGIPAPEMLPYRELATISQEILQANGIFALKYGITEGYAPLIEQVKARLAKEKTGNDQDDTIIVTGGQQGLELVAKVILNEGDGVACENPSFIGGLNAFRSYKAELHGVDMDEDGMNMDCLDATLAAHPNIKLIYTIPTFQNPTGRTMSVAKRKRILELAEKHNVLILEDNPYADLRFAGQPVPSIKSMDTDNRVIYVGSFSKTVAPGLRVGFVCAAKPLVEKMVVCKQVSDVHTNLLGQMCVSEYLNRYDLDEHVAQCAKVHGEKCSLMKACIDRYFPKNVTTTSPEGGIFLWCDTHDGQDSKLLNTKAVERNVAIVPGFSAMPDDTVPTSAFRLNFSAATLAEIETGIKTLGEVLHGTAS